MFLRSAMSSYTKGLNASQKEVVLHDFGPLMVLAGAGSGKTRVLTMRVARLVGEMICWPKEILAVTFTNKASREMQERIASMVSKPAATAMTISTFHSLGARILRQEGHVIGLKKTFTIMDDHERLSTIKSLMRLSGRAADAADEHEELATRISLFKNASLDPADCDRDEPVSNRHKKVYAAYQQTLLKRQTVDFDDLLLLPLRILQNHPEVLRTYQKQYRFVLIDEYQDTNAVQMQMAALLAAPQNNIMVVGDDDQSIYSWRGACSSNILSFTRGYKSAKTVILDTNYRSTRQILEGAHAVVAHNKTRTIKHITAAAGDGEPILHYRADDEEDEAIWVAASIKENVDHCGSLYTDHALLFRTNAMMRRFEEEMRVQNVPYRVVGAMSFYDRKEIKDIVAYMRFFANPSDELSFLRVLKTPDRGFAKSTIAELDSLASHRRMSLFDAMSRSQDATDILPTQHEKCRNFVQWAQGFFERLAQGKNLALILDEILQTSNYYEALTKAYQKDGNAEDRVRNVKEMVHGLEIFEHKRREPSLASYLQHLALTMNDNPDEEQEKRHPGVTFMTIHKSKGLEFPIVYLPGLDDAAFPSPRSIAEGNVEEERRLFYVAMTRARRRLVLTYPNTRVQRGKDKKVTPCRFLFEIPEEFLDGPLGQKAEEEYQDYVSDFFTKMKQELAEKAGQAPQA
jgi:superfamily I DNA/RNA helicase